MSLHLIESTKVPVRSTRKRSGVLASVLLHSAFVVGAFTSASAFPTVHEPRVTTDLIYVPPAPPIIAQHATEVSAPSQNTIAAQTQVVLPVMPDLSTIPIDIPPIAADPSYMMDLLLTREMAHGSSQTRNGASSGSEPGNGTASVGGVLSDLQVDRPVTILSGYRTPRYPEALRAAGVEERLSASFVVDTLGRVESGSLEIPDAQHASFVGAVREALANARFRPAESQGRRVRQRVVQAFVFSLQRE